MRRAMCALLALWPALLGAQEVGPVFEATAGSAEEPVAGMAADGRFVVSWTQLGPLGQARDVWARRFDADGQALAAAFRVNTFTSADEKRPAVAVNATGQFTVVWNGVSGNYNFRPAILGQRFASDGTRVGGEFLVNSYTTFGGRVDPAVALQDSGAMVVVWAGSQTINSSGTDVLARRFDAGGAPIGVEFVANSATANWQISPSVAFDQAGGFVVAWQTNGQDGSADVLVRRFSAAGTPLGADLQVNQYTTGIQGFPAVSAAGAGFAVAWLSDEGTDGSGPGVFARRFDAAGAPLGPEFRVTDTPVRFQAHACSLVAEARGGFAVGWVSGFDQSWVRRYDGNGQAIGPAVEARAPDGRSTSPPVLGSDRAGRLMAAWVDEPGFGGALRGRRFEGLWTTALAVDVAAGGTGDRNGVLDPGETVVVAPSWANAGSAPLSAVGAASAFTGPGAPSNPSYLIFDAVADYGIVAEGGTSACSGQSDCYLLGLTPPNPRPLRHMDAAFREDLAVVGAESPLQAWGLHIGGSFDDVARTSPFYRFVETAFHYGITGGCSATAYCPDAVTTREQMAVFLLTAKLSTRYQAPRPPVGVFVDVPVTSPFAPWVEDLWNREIVSGCAVDHYCPADPVTRAQMAVMLLRTVEGTSYVPPACTTPVFTDVPCSDPFARWINELSLRGITAGCGPGLYCPNSGVTRAQMAVFVARAFNLSLYGA